MVIVSSDVHQGQWITATNIGGDTLIAVSNPGYSNYARHSERIQRFELFKIKRRQNKWRLLLFGSYGSQCTEEYSLFLR